MSSVENIVARLQRTCKDIGVSEFSTKSFVEFRLDVPRPRHERSCFTVPVTDNPSRCDYHCKLRLETYSTETSKKQIQNTLSDIINRSAVDRDAADILIVIPSVEVIGRDPGDVVHQPHIFLHKPRPNEVVELSRSLSSAIDYDTFHRAPGWGMRK